MSKTQLQTNNAKLSALITELQGKATGGGGGGGTASETCTISFTDYFEGGGVLYYSDGTQIIEDSDTLILFDVPITVAKNSIIYIYCHGFMPSNGFTFSNDAAHLLIIENQSCAIAVTGDCVITPVW